MVKFAFHKIDEKFNYKNKVILIFLTNQESKYLFTWAHLQINVMMIHKQTNTLIYNTLINDTSRKRRQKKKKLSFKVGLQPLLIKINGGLSGWWDNNYLMMSENGLACSLWKFSRNFFLPKMFSAFLPLLSKLDRLIIVDARVAGLDLRGEYEKTYSYLSPSRRFRRFQPRGKIQFLR